MTKIEWADRVWNPIIGCSAISEGCAHCYAKSFAQRLAGQKLKGYPDVKDWQGETVLLPDRLGDPQKLPRKSQRVFVGSMTDLFHPHTPAAWVDSVLKAAALAPQHLYLILTKRPSAMRLYFGGADPRSLPPRLAVGVSVENQKTADYRIQILRDTCVANRFISYEPAIGAADFLGAITGDRRAEWLIAGAETGPGKRTANLNWFRATRDLCAAAGVPFFFKKDSEGRHTIDGETHESMPNW